MKFRVELRDTAFNIKEIYDEEYFDLNWSYSAIGGCGEFSFKLPRKRFEERALRGDFNVRIYGRDDSSDSYSLWYQGLITNKVPAIQGKTETIEVSGHGYINQLSRIYLNNITYTSQEVSLIVKDLLDNYITTDTNVTYTASDIEVTSFTVDSIQFNDDALSAIEKLADIVGGIEYGVDRNRNFFFKARATTVGIRYYLGKNIRTFEDNQDFSEIINQVYVQGAQVGGTYFQFGPYDDVNSQVKYNLRTDVRQNSSVTTSTVAAQLATAILDEFSEVTRKARADLMNVTALIEGTTPIPLVNEISRKIKYGQKKYGTFLYSGLVNRKLARINYSLTNNGSLNVSVDLDKLRPAISEQISQLEYNLEQTRSASL